MNDRMILGDASARIEIPLNVRRICGLLSSCGFEAYPVGGCVRDSLLGITPSDWDIATSAVPSEMKAALSDPDIVCVPTGLKHGTITAVTDHVPYEITTFRSENGYSDGRHPDSVDFVKSIKEDLMRRDFTVNAMAYDIKSDRLIDLFGGREDLKNGILRCVGEPKLRFGEDALRILRALRFASTYGFEIDKDTADAALALAGSLLKISEERIFSELKKLLCGRDAGRILMLYRDIFAVIMPELKPMFDFPQRTPYHIYDVWRHTVHSVAAIKPVPELRLTMLLHDSGKPVTHSVENTENGILDHFYAHAHKSEEIAGVVLKRFKSDNKTLDTVKLLIRHHGDPLEPKTRSVMRKLNKFGEENLRRLIEVKRADTSAQSPEFSAERLGALDEFEQLLDECIEQERCFSLRDLAVSGRDMQMLGLMGKQIGAALNLALSAVIDGKIENNKEMIIKYIRRKNNA